MNDDLRLAIDVIKSGDTKKGRSLLAKILKEDARNEQAWLWMAAVIDERAKQVYCLQKVLEINPNNLTAQNRLAKVRVPEVIDRQEESLVYPQPVQRINERQSQNLTTQRTELSDSQLIQAYVAKMTRYGWQVIHQTESSVQLRKPKKWSGLLLGIGFILLCAAGLGVIVLLLAAIDYATRKESIIFTTADELRQQNIQSVTRKNRANSNTLLLAVIGVILFIGFGFVFVVIIASPGVNNSSDESPSMATAPTLPPTFTPVGQVSGHSDKIRTTRTNLMNHFERIYSYDWTEFHYSGGDYPLVFFGLDPNYDGDLTIRPEIDDSENIEVVTYALSFNKNAVDQQRIAYGVDSMVDIVKLCLPNWRGGEDWVRNSVESVPDYHTIQEFETKVNQVDVLLSVGPEIYGDLYIMIFDLSENSTFR